MLSNRKPFDKTLTPRESVERTLAFSDELRYYYDPYQLLLFNFQEKHYQYFLELIEEQFETVNKQ